MPKDSLRQRVEALLARSAHRLTGQGGFEHLAEVLESAAAQLAEPMRVAIVGLIKAGKSTLLNALLGERLVPTGSLETSFNVTWLHYGETPRFSIEFEDGRPSGWLPLEQLADLIRRHEDGTEQPAGIRYLHVFYPNLLLREIELIDLPGLASSYLEDSVNAQNFLQLHGQDLTDITRRLASKADAILYLFSRGINVSDLSTVSEFQGPLFEGASPLNSIGVLTKVDVYWPSVEDPLAAGDTISRRLADDPRVKTLFYAVLPICATLAEGGRRLQPEDLATLKELASLPEPELERLSRSVDRFVKGTAPNIAVSSGARQRVLERLGLYGVHLACRLLRDGGASPAELPDLMLRRSGIPVLADQVRSHFGHRAFLIKLANVLSRLRAELTVAREQLAGSPRDLLDDIAEDWENFRANEHAFAELGVLRALFQGKLNITADENTQILAVTGEFGADSCSRLAIPWDSDARSQRAVALMRLDHWQVKVEDARFVNPETARAARIIARSFEILADDLEHGDP